ncbi:unnamed protein product [Symbiodinium sp. CCMP2592]|nr:unnamed protein product [Symbiodinium sp. CCMP2592]
MGDESRQDSFNSYIPIWDGNAGSMRKFKKSVTLWLAGLDLERTASYNLAARFLLRQTGAARARGEEEDIDTLAHRPAVADVVGTEIQAADYTHGVWHLVKCFEELCGKTASEKRGELRQKLYVSLRRGPSEPVTNFASTWRTLVAECIAEGIPVTPVESGWLFKERLALTEMQRQVVETATGEEPEFAVVEREVLRLFRRVHLTRSEAAGGSHLRSWRQAFVTEERYEDETEEYEDEPEGETEAYETAAEEEDGGEAAADELETELEAMAAALDEGDDLPPEVAEEAAAHLENAGEALVTLREARRQIAAIRKDRGYKAPGAVGSAGGGGRGTAPGKGAGRGVCHNCGQAGGRSPKHVHYTETEANVVDFMDHGASVEVDEFEVMMTLAEALEVSSLPKRGSPPTLLGAMDSACNRTCAGPEWIKQALAAIPPEYLSLVVENHEAERFRFGNNQTLVSSRRVRIPCCLEGQVMLLWVSDVPNPKLGCLVGRDCMEALGAVLDFEDHMARFKTLGLGPLRLPQLRAGHLGLPLFPKAGWPAVGGLRSFKPLGRNGVVELQLGFGAWMRLRTKAAWQLMLTVSESFVSEQAVVDSRAALTSTSVPVSKPTSKPAAVLLESPKTTQTPSVSHAPRPGSQVRRKMAKNGGAFARAFGLALAGLTAVAGAHASTALRPLPVEVGNRPDGMARTVRGHGATRSVHTRAVENRVFSGVSEEQVRLQRMQLEEAKKAQSEVKEVREERMRALLGPRGGLPRLRAELLELAVLLRVDIEEKDTVETIRKKVTPVARAIALPPPPSQASSSSEVTRPKAPSRTAGPMGSGSDFGPPTRLAAPPMEEETVPSDDSFRMITSEELVVAQATAKALRQASASASPAAVHEALQVLANAEEAAAFHDCFVQAADSEVAAHFERRGHGTRAYCPDAYGHVGVFRAKRGAVDRQALENWMVGAASLRAEDRPVVLCLVGPAQTWRKAVQPWLGPDLGLEAVGTAGLVLSNLPAVLDGARDGRYATFWHLRRALPRLFERRFDSFHSTLAVDQQNNLDGGESRAFENSPDTAGEPPAGGLPFPFRAVENSPDTAGEPLEGQEEQEEMDALVKDAPKPTKEIVQAVAKLHRNTGHVSKRRLARALAVSGAPPVVIRAALELRCEICAEEARPKTRMPASLPRASHFGDRVHGDLFSFKDGAGQTRWVAHWVDVATRYQACSLLRSKTAQEVGATLAEWTRIFGAPKTLVVDMGPEFVAESFQDLCDFYDTVLHHIPVEAPWRNGVAERAGASTKAVLQRLVKEYLPVTEVDVSQVVTAAAGAYNDDINDSGYSPSQAVFGRQPKSFADCLDPGLAQTALTNEPSFCRALAIRETARVAMLRLHYSQAMSKALLARSRAPHPEHYNAGDVVYFYRRQKSKPGKKLQLKAWHGPALVVAMEGPDENQLSAHIAHRGNVMKVAIQHLRKASALERLAATDWAPALQTVLNEVTDAPEPVPTETTADPADTPAEEVPAGNESGPSPVVVVVPGPGGGSQPSLSLPPGSRRPSLSSLAPWEKESHSVYPRVCEERPASKAKPLGEPVVGEPMDGTSEALGLREAAVESAAPSAPELVPILEETVGESPEAQSSPVDESTSAPVSPFDHPLVRLMEQVVEDRHTGYEDMRCGTWDGRWPTPSEVQRKRLQATGDLMTLPVESEACLASAGKEITWSRLDVKTKDAFQKAADEQWQKWTENGSVQELSVEESRRVQADLKRSGKSGDLLTPRWVLTDKNAALSTPGNPLPAKPSARLVVPGFKDTAHLEGRLRTDAPTASRIAILLLCAVAAHFPSWELVSADVRAAFLKGDAYMAGSRTLYMQQPDRRKGPSLPGVRFGVIFRVLKGVFGLADAPRQWYLRLCRTLQEHGWVKSALDGALFYLRAPSGELLALMVVHVDDLLFAGCKAALEILRKIGKELGFGALSHSDFQYSVLWTPNPISMVEYHENLHVPVVSRADRKDLERALGPSEVRRLRTVVGSLQWLVSQLRFDHGFALSSLQSEQPPTVGTLLKAAQLARELKNDAHFTLTYRPVDVWKGGLVTVSDAALGNVNADKTVKGNLKLFSQGCYAVLLADEELVKGRRGVFNLLNFRSHKIARVCRSSYAAETLGVEEALDAGELCRAFLAEVRGASLLRDRRSVYSVPLVAVTDAKDVHDRCSNDLGFGAQKSLVLTLASLRQQLREPNTAMRWTHTDNLFVDGGTKEMDSGALRTVLSRGTWSIEHEPEFVKSKKGKKKPAPTTESVDQALPGEPLPDGDLKNYVTRLARQPGWHSEDGVLVQVAEGAKSFRCPEPRASRLAKPLRTTIGLFEVGKGQMQWRILELDALYSEEPQPNGKLPRPSVTLVTFFQGQNLHPVAEDGVKDKFGRFLVFWIAQGMWVMLISMPNLFINSSSVSRPLNWFDWLLVAGFAYAVAVEILADIQKANWVSAGRPGGFCQVGVWSLSRHPNYFGEIFQWWCAFALAYNSSEASSGYMDPLWWACILSPLFTMHILLNIGATGISNAEGKNLKRYYEKCPEEYAEYRKNTSILIPMVGYRHIPLSVKRTLLFEFERYEYRPGGGSEVKTD